MLSKKLIVLTSVPLFLIGLMIVIILPVAKIERSPTRMIVFEACSQSTTLYIFDVNNKTSMGKESKFTVSPSISEYSGKDYKEIETYLKPLFDFIDQNVPKKEMKEIPVYFLAKEELGLKKNQEANKLVEYISRRLTMTDFVFEKNHIEMMGESEEGLSLWLSTNYLYNTLQKNNNVPNKEKSQSPSFVGIHDIEVESTQIVFVPEQTQKGESTRSVRRNGETYKLYEHSYMGYGMNSSRDLFEKKLDKADENGNLLNPCLPKDFKRFSEVLQKDMIGTSDPALCSTLISSLFDKSCTKTSCGFNDIYQPPLNGKFISKGSNVESTAKFLGIKFNEATPKKMNDAAQTLCSLTLNDYTKKYNSDPENYCFQAFYLSSIWSRGFGFDENQNIEIVDRVDEHDVSLALGYSLLKLDSYPKQNYVQTVAGVGVYYLLSAMGGIFIILSAILFSFYFKRPSYSPSD